ncbi:hypothetical protein T492DRAFT_858806 [Pavlovales sp. CCMP2436]|nr:hypothetical protein T492DRAFT_858806 [Pavlovales sp. CCMP2436]
MGCLASGRDPARSIVSVLTLAGVALFGAAILLATSTAPQFEGLDEPTPQAWDVDGDGYVSAPELAAFFSRVRPDASEGYFVMMMRVVNADKDGQLSYEEAQSMIDDTVAEPEQMTLFDIDGDEIRRMSFEGMDADWDGALSAEEINDADDS